MASLAGPTTSLLMWMSRMPAATKGRASLTFWQQMPRAPSANWRNAISGHLCALACGRKAPSWRSAQACMARRLASKGARSSTRLGVSTRARGSPGCAGGGSAMPRMTSWDIG
ncbi:hypothetical protein G6F65_020079 [Rhizopus arrhizus]|nr:hypothetical protein G6F65_020079 [Rhizopus arrhizus]